MTLAVAFASSAASKFHLLDADKLATTLLTIPVDCVTVSNLPIDCTESVHRGLSEGSSAFLGCFEVDKGDPLVLTLAANGLIPFCTYTDGVLGWVVPFDYSPDDDWEVSWTKDLDFDSVEFTRARPEYLRGEPMSAMGVASTRLLKARARPQHAEAVLTELRELLDTAKGVADVSVTFGKQEFGDPRADVSKTRDYCLNEEHEKGKHKALLFRQLLGITPANWYVLAEQLAAGIEQEVVNRPEKTKWGVQYEVKIPVTGPNGLTKLVTSGWIIRQNEPPSLTSAYIEEGAETNKVSLLAPFLINSQEMPDFHKNLFETAHAHALAESENWTPTPMWIEGYDKPISEGMVGSAWIELPDGKSPFPRWLRKHGLCSAYSRSRQIPARTGSQSVEKERKYCEAFARVLRLNGIACKVGWRLD